MLFRDVIKLGNITDSVNDIGDPIQTLVYGNDIFANEKSVKRVEFYQAMATGLKPELVFEISKIDYAQQPYLKHNDNEYKIMRTYSKNGEIIELICEGIVNGVI